MTLRATFSTKLLHGALRIMPGRIKRLVFISSLHSRIEDGTIEEEIARNLNHVMVLASTSDKMPTFPLQLSKLIWKEHTPIRYGDQPDSALEDVADFSTKSFSKQQLRILADQLLKITPDCLKYSSNTKMKDDVLQLFGSIAHIDN